MTQLDAVERESAIKMLKHLEALRRLCAQKDKCPDCCLHEYCKERCFMLDETCERQIDVIHNAFLR